MQAPRRDTGSERNSLQAAGQFLGLGLQFCVAILLFLFAGQWLDERLGTEPWLLMLGVFLGAGLGFYSIYRQLVIEPQARERRERADREER